MWSSWMCNISLVYFGYFSCCSKPQFSGQCFANVAIQTYIKYESKYIGVFCNSQSGLLLNLPYTQSIVHTQHID